MALEGLQNGRYCRLRLLGSGSMGEVYLMEDTRINRHVAIKVIRGEANPHPDSDAARDAARLFQREARTIAALDHPNILPLYDFGEESLHGSTLTYMVMPFCMDGSFADWLSHHGVSPLLSPQDVAYFVEQAAEALQYAHDHQTLHLDVKPSNFLIRSTKNPNRPSLLLADFGVARLSATTSSSSRTVRGTPIAMAPEQWSGRPVAASDQYALAVMAYQLLMGRPPFLGGLEQLMYQHFHDQPQPPSTVNLRLSGVIDAVILRALAKRPEERYPSISAFASALGQTVQQIVPTEPVISPQQPSGSDIHATLAISKAEALNGASRTLTLPGGRSVTVMVPPGAYDGQVIRLPNVGEPSRSGGPAGALIVTIAIQQTDEADLPAWPGSADPTFQSANVSASPPNPQESLIPPPSLLPPTVAAAIYSTQEPTVLAPPPPPSNQGIPAHLSPIRGIIPPRSPLSRGKSMLLVGLALVLIASGIGLYSLVHTNQGATTNAHATAVANAHATATTAAVNATSTALTNAITPTVNATARATALQITYNNDTLGTPTLDDPLRDNSKGYGWIQDANSYGGNCAFTGGAYHVSQTNKNYLNDCFATTTDFSNFVFEVQMKIIKGDEGGIGFLYDTTKNHIYLFIVGQDGSYQLSVCPGPTCNTLTSGTSSAIKQGLNQTNLIAVIAQVSAIGLYVNHQLIDSVDDSTSSSGQIGVIASNSNSNTTEVVYSNAKVWTS